ncbi:MAG TPA: DUF4245 domain-containing protein [Mycobacteriales bacterium]|nr:DUF4245 domain-containing protein [Mycobacteriales bacterium]
MTSTDVAQPKRGRESAADMIRSLGLVGVVIAATLIFVPGLFHPSKSQQFPALDYSDYVSGFHQETGRTALTPRPLPSGWKGSAATLTGPAAVEHLHIGFATPGRQYAGLEESVANVTAFAPTVLGARGSAVTGTVTIAGASWQTRTSSRGEYSLSRTMRGVAVVITGSATDAQLQLLAGSLH